jgi:hypothetical protein
MSRVALGSFALALALSTIACASHKGTGGNTTGGDPNGDGKTDPTPGVGQVVQKGTIVDFDTKKPVKGANVSAAGQTVTTDADGAYALILEKGKPFTMEVTMENYAKLVEQETSLDADFDKGKTSFIGTFTASFLTGTLDGYDASLGVLSVQLIPTGNCSNEDGAKVTVSPEGSAKVKYVSGGIPSSRRAAVTAGQFPSAVIYNVQPGVPVSVSVQHDKCKETAFPVVKDGVSYTGGITTEAGQATSFARIFLE